MKFDIIICTYNRHNKVFNLVNELLKVQIENLSKIIVVDSSDSVNDKFKKSNQIKYIHSSHKNQPYQRYLGYEVSTSDWLMFLDDDMELVDDHIFEDLANLIQSTDSIGIAINFKDKHPQNVLAKVPRSVNRFLPENLSNLLRKISFNKTPETGKIGLFGQRGKQPDHLHETEIVSGGAFMAKKKYLFADFNVKLFDLFEQRIGMGEDTLIGYGLSKRGKIIYYETVCFLHNDETGSNYSLDIKKYAERVIFSRLFIAFEKNRMDKIKFSSLWLAYSAYVMFRLFGALISLFLSPSKNKFNMIKGAILGYKNSITYDFSFSETRNVFWRTEVKFDATKFSNHH